MFLLYLLKCTIPTFFNIYNLPFSHSQNIGKVRVNVGPKTIFPAL